MRGVHRLTAARALALRLRLLGVRASGASSSRRVAGIASRGGCLGPRGRAGRDAAAQRGGQRGRGGRVGRPGVRRGGAGPLASPAGNGLMPIITVSRQFGAGGSRVAEKVADALGWQLYDNAMVDEVAARLGTTGGAGSARGERAPSFARRVASTLSLTATQFLPDVSGEGILPSEERIVDVTKRVMEEAVSAGPAVIVGRGAQCLPAMRSDALHVFCYAPPDALVPPPMTRDSLSREAG